MSEKKNKIDNLDLDLDLDLDFSDLDNDEKNIINKSSIDKTDNILSKDINKEKKDNNIDNTNIIDINNDFNIDNNNTELGTLDNKINKELNLDSLGIESKDGEINYGNEYLNKNNEENNKSNIDINNNIDNKKNNIINNIKSKINLNNKKVFYGIIGGIIFFIILLIFLIFSLFLGGKTKIETTKNINNKSIDSSITVINENEQTNSGEANITNNLTNSGEILDNNGIGDLVSNETNNSGEILNINSGSNNVITGNENVENVNSGQKLDNSDITIPLKGITEKVNINKDGTLKITDNTDFETRNVKDGSIILDNSQNKAPKLLDFTINGIKEGGIYKITDDLGFKIDGITNSLSIDPKFKTTINGNVYILNITLDFFKDSIISGEKGTFTFEDKLPLNFMTRGEKLIYFIVNGTIFKILKFNIE